MSISPVCQLITLLYKEKEPTLQCVWQQIYCMFTYVHCVHHLFFLLPYKLSFKKYLTKHRFKWAWELRLCCSTLHITHETRIWAQQGAFSVNWQCISGTTKCTWRVSEQENIGFPAAEIAFGFPQHRKLQFSLLGLDNFITKEIYKHTYRILRIE